MKILYVTTIGVTMGFFKSFIKSLLDDGHIVDIATNESGSGVPDCYRLWGCVVHSISTTRSPLSKGNLYAIRQLRRIVKEGNYELVHCHTPIAAMCARLACIPFRKKGVRVIYTAHGFHFYRGAPLKNWLIFYPIEKLCSFFTDVLITINQEDYHFALKKMKTKQIAYVPGVGIDTEKFHISAAEKTEIRRKIRQCHGIPETAKLLLSVGEVNENKNHGLVIEALSMLAEKDVYYIICGNGPLMDDRKAQADALGIGPRVILAGYRDNVRDYYLAADIFVFPSFREGLPVSVMEAIASSLPIVSSNIRGNKDLAEYANTGVLFDPKQAQSLANILDDIISRIAESNLLAFEYLAALPFNEKVVISKMKEIYFRKQ